MSARSARKRKGTTDKDAVRSTDDTSMTLESSGSKRKWVVLILCLVTLCAGIYFAPRDYKRTPQKYQDHSPPAEGEETSKEVSTCESLLEAAKNYVDTNEEKNYEPALDLVANCIVQEPNNTVALWNLASILLKIGRIEEALMFIDDALTKDPDNLDFYRSASLLLFDLHRHNEVVLTLERYLELLLGVPSWPHLLANIVVQREDEWSFLLTTTEGNEIIDMFLKLLKSYLHEKLVLKASYLYKIIIGLKGVSNSRDLMSPFAFLSLGLGDISTGIKYLRHDMEVKYVDQGFGNEEYAYEVVTAHSLRLLTAGFDANIVNMARHLLMMGKSAWDEHEYNCQLSEDEQISYDMVVMQKDVRNIFSLCLTRQGIIDNLVGEGAVVYAENRFGWTPLLNAASLGSVSVLNDILSHSQDGPQSRTALWHTSLHIAAMKGNYDIVKPLLEAGLSPKEEDLFNKTALDIACSHRWTAEKFSTALGRAKLAPNCLKKISYHPPIKHSQGGWNDSPFVLPNILTEDKCDFDVVSDISNEDFLYEYLSLQRPVIVRNVVNSKNVKNLFRKWQRQQFVKEYGTLEFKEVVVPYGESFGYSDNETKFVTLQEFVNKMDQLSQMGEKEYPSQPSYIFEPISENSPLLDDFVLPSILDPELTHATLSHVQFYIGPALSGAPGHFHRNAWNVLIYGKKRWFLYPPTEAFYSRQHVWQWWQQQQKPIGALECLQYPGDLVFVPDMWGHAVLNLQESVGLAAEFIYGASEFSL
ncbi:uncharacterized protein [Dysidea avara]|uniref:uncharacterized protein n=1 Tax=Dysidea avara TaxID=196820 RepID=UPI003318601D